MSEIVENLVSPLTGDNPCGELAKYEPEYEAMDIELQKLNSVDAVPVNWKDVENNATAILSNKSKDIQVAGYFAIGRLENAGVSGLIEGLMVIDSLVEQYWAELYPAKKRLRGRVQALEWVNEQLAKRLDSLLNRASVDELKSVLALFDSIARRFAEETDGAQVPDFTENTSKISRQLGTLERQQKELENKRQQAEEKKAQGIHEIERDSDISPVLKTNQQNLKNIAEYYRSKSSADPRAYRFSRAAAWSAIAVLPQVRDGRSVLPPMQPQLREQLLSLMEQKEYAQVVAVTEKRLVSAPYYIDLHRFSFDALTALGSEYLLAAEAVRSELAGFLARFPELLTMSCNDGSSLMDDLTRDWLQREVLLADGHGEAGEAAGSFPWDDGLHEAKLLAAKGKFNEGLALLDAGKNMSTGGREQAYWTCAQALFCLDGGLPQQAVSQLEYINDVLTDSAIEKWDPELVRKVSRLLLTCYDALLENRPGNVPGLKQRVITQFERLSRIDTEFAIKMSEAKGLKPVLMRMYELK